VRVLLKNSQIEATPAIDSATEAPIQKAFEMLIKGHTTFINAHRLRTMVDADQIFVIDKGGSLKGERMVSYWGSERSTVRLRTKQTAATESKENFHFQL
jgi:ABC-type bacteriocin/lantibiotic exporter with double-glycine peptidase domain